MGLGIVFGVTLMYALRDQGLERISIPIAQLVVFLALSLVIGRARGGAPRPAGRPP